MQERNTLFRELNNLGFYKELEEFAEAPVLCRVAPDPSPRPVLRIGYSGNHVRYLQQRLNCHKVKYQSNTLSAESDYTSNQLLMPLKIDGIFGPKTRKAVLAFQEGRFLETDGVVGPITWTKLNEYNRTIIKTTDGLTRRVMVPCPGVTKDKATRKNCKVIADKVEADFGLNNLRNVGECSLAIGAWDREGEVYKDKKLLHWFWLHPGEVKSFYKPPKGTAEVTVSCELECNGTGILELPLAVS